MISGETPVRAKKCFRGEDTEVNRAHTRKRAIERADRSTDTTHQIHLLLLRHDTAPFVAVVEKTNSKHEDYPQTERKTSLKKKRPRHPRFVNTRQNGIITQ